MSRIRTPLAERIGLKYPIVSAPMFIISNKEMIVAAAEAGILGSMPSINLRTHEAFREALAWIRQRTDRPFAINLTIKLTEPERLAKDFEACIEFGVPVLITSYGNPTEIARRAHERGMVVMHDVIHLKHALKAQESGADAIIGVAAGAGGHLAARGDAPGGHGDGNRHRHQQHPGLRKAEGQRGTIVEHGQGTPAPGDIAGADPLLADRQGVTALQHARALGHHSLAALLS